MSPAGEREIAALIVDDQDDIRFLVRTIIESSDAGVVVAGEAASGREALALLAEHEPDVALIDVVIPPGPDLEVARAVREQHPEVPVVLFSAHVDDELRESAAGLGIAACLAKSDVTNIPGVLRQVAWP
jgi:DNA-binding NarL/FixJ family response regulator